MCYVDLTEILLEGCVLGIFVWPVAVDITKMISDRRGGDTPHLVHDTLLGTSTVIQCYPLVRAFHYPPPEDRRGCQRVPASCPRFFAFVDVQFMPDPPPSVVVYIGCPHPTIQLDVFDSQYVCNLFYLSYLANDKTNILHSSDIFMPVLVFFSRVIYPSVRFCKNCSCFM